MHLSFSPPKKSFLLYLARCFSYKVRKIGRLSRLVLTFCKGMKNVYNLVRGFAEGVGVVVKEKAYKSKKGR